MRNTIAQILALLFVFCTSQAANYTLEIIQPQPSLDTTNRYYKAFPGAEYKVPIGVIGGAFPFTYSLTANTTCGGAIDSSGVITWSDPAAEDTGCIYDVLVTDDEAATDTVSWTVTVTTTGFVFIDANNGTHSEYNGCSSSCGDGSQANPFADIGDIYAGHVEVSDEDFSSADCGAGTPCGDTTYDNQILYFMSGTYAPKGLIGNVGAVDGKIDWRTHKPMIWLEYPGETAIIDHTADDASLSGAMFKSMDGLTQGNYFFQGITFTNPRNNSLYFGGAGVNYVIFDCVFQDMYGATDGFNPGYIMLGTAGQYPNNPVYGLIKGNSFLNAAGASTSYLKFYSVDKLVVSDNTISDDTGTDTEGIALKAYVKNVDVRNNYINGIESHAIGGNFNYSDDNEIRFNRIINASPTAYGGLVLNYQGENTGTVYAHRNTIEGAVSVRAAAAEDGPFYIYSNVIVNESGEADGIDCGIDSPCTDESSIILGTGATANLVGDAEDGIIDASGNLTTEYIAYLGTHGYELGGVPPTITGVPIINGVTIR